MSRLVMNMLQFEQNLIPVKVLKEQKATYIEALNKTRDCKDINIFCDMMLQMHNSNLQNEIAEFKASMAQETMPSAPADVTQSGTHVTQNVTQSSTNDSKAATYMLTPRQQQILQMMQTDGSVSASTMAVRLGFTIRTIRRDIETLRKHYTIRWIGSSKQGHWQILPQNVEQ